MPSDQALTQEVHEKVRETLSRMKWTLLRLQLSDLYNIYWLKKENLRLTLHAVWTCIIIIVHACPEVYFHCEHVHV